MSPQDINYPKPPEGGWKKWFLEHPHQHMVLPVIHRGIIDTFEIWWDSRFQMLRARHGDWQGTWDIMRTNDSFFWNQAVEKMFSAAMLSQPGPEQPEEQPVPSGTGWEDFDWSK